MNKLTGWCAAAAVAALLLSPLAIAGKYDSKVTIKNKSSWDIHQLYLSSVDVEEWGPDQLGDNVIEGGGSYTLHSIPCDSYDVKVVDEDGDECVVGGVDMCADNNTWVVTDDDLLECQAATQ